MHPSSHQLTTIVLVSLHLLWETQDSRMYGDAWVQRCWQPPPPPTPARYEISRNIVETHQKLRVITSIVHQPCELAARTSEYATKTFGCTTRKSVQRIVHVVVVVVVLTLTRIIQSVVTGQAPVTLELRNKYPREKTQTRGGTRIYHS